jgi:two-component system, NtrC family, sensor kinase
VEHNGRMPRSLAWQLIVSLSLVLVVVEGVAGYYNIRSQEEQLLNTIILGADQLSRGITSATWHAMLADQRESAYEVMRTVARREGISKIRIFNREGQVMFSTRPEETHRKVEKTAESCALCHASNSPRLRIDLPARGRVYSGADGRRALAMVTPIYNEPACSQADCHAHPSGTQVLGVLDVDFALDHVDREVARLKFRIGAVTIGETVLLGALIILFVRRFVSRPIRKLIDSAEAIGSMQLDQPVRVDTSEELDALARSFETMRQQLQQALKEIGRFTQSLESKVTERTEQLRIAQLKLAQSDRLASLGQLAASITHEINNPVAGLLNLTMLMQRIMRQDGVPPDRVEEFKHYLVQAASETARVGRIVSDMLAFARRSNPVLSAVDLNTIVRDTVALASARLKQTNIILDLDLSPDLPPFSGVASQIQQVIMNLLLNGIDAVQSKGGGRVAIRTYGPCEGGSIVLDVRDTGEGISEDNLPRIFDPFFTTKTGKGAGLGLSVVYGIVKAHGGDIEVEGGIGGGTIFRVMLPLAALEKVAQA